MNNSNAIPSSVRYQERWSLMYYLRVFSQPSGQLLGHLVDINTDGAMIISEKPLTVNRDFILSMELPDSQGRLSPIVMSASIIWSKPDVNPHFIDTGIQLIEPTNEAVTALIRLIEQLKSFDHISSKPTQVAEQNLYLELPKE